MDILKSAIKDKHVKKILRQLRNHDETTYHHSLRVAILAIQIGHAMNLNTYELTILAYSGLLHDAGKLCVPKYILTKPGRLTEEEFEQMKTHPAYSYMIIKNETKLNNEIADAALYHHINEDGTGYPILPVINSIYPKIIRLADSYDAIISKRPYKKEKTIKQALAILQQEQNNYNNHLVKELQNIKQPWKML